MNPSDSSFWAGLAGSYFPLGPLLLAALAGYLLGSLPFGCLVARAHGVNIFEVGSKSSGATNVRRILGAKAGYTVFALDALKGALAAGWPLYFLWAAYHAPQPQEAALVRGLFLAKFLGIASSLFAMLGHSFSCFTGFKGGKGVATGAGAFLVLMPPVTLIAVGIWALTFFSSGYVSLASILAVATMPLAAFFVGEQPFVIIVAGAAAIFVTVRHRANIVRLWQGTENKAAGRSGGTP